MKYIKPYNEAVIDFLKPKSDELIDKELSKLSKEDLIKKSLENNYVNGLKIATSLGLSKEDIELICNSLEFDTSKEIFEYILTVDEIKSKLNKNIIYVIQKYVIGLHQDELKDFEKWFIEQITNLNVYQSKNNQDILIYKKDKDVLFNYDQKSHFFYFYYDYGKIYLFFEREFGFNYLSMNLIIKNLVEKYLKIRVDTPSVILKNRE